jgi:hypothetical protein
MSRTTCLALAAAFLLVLLFPLHLYGSAHTVNAGAYIEAPACDVGFETRGTDGAGPWVRCTEERE